MYASLCVDIFKSVYNQNIIGFIKDAYFYHQVYTCYQYFIVAFYCSYKALITTLFLSHFSLILLSLSLLFFNSAFCYLIFIVAK